MINKLNEYKKTATNNYNKYKTIINNLSNARLLIFILSIISILMGYYKNSIFTIIGYIFFIIFIVLIIIHNKYYKDYNYYEKYLLIINEYIDRTTNKWQEFSDKGEDFLNGKNTYLKDLDILGNNSLFQYLSIAKTMGGRRKLYKRFTSINEDSTPVLELSKNIDFCIDFQISLDYFRNKKIDLSSIYNNQNKKKPFIYIWLLLTIITIILLILFILNIINIKYFILLFIINYSVSTLYYLINSKYYNSIKNIIDISFKLKSTFNTISKYSFNNSYLSNIKKSSDKVLKLYKNIDTLEILNNMRDNLLSNILFNGLLHINIYTLYLYNKYNIDTILNKEVSNIEELEALISLSIIGVVKNNVTTIDKSNNIEIKFKDLYHPLIKEDEYKPNSFNTITGTNIITGSNMGGKSTFLRTIGINQVLANAGGLVNAKYYKTNFYKIFTSMRIGDDVINGISTFYGELLRISDALKYISNNKPTIIFIDEIFKGTNYIDRLYGASEAIRKLNKSNVILFITTHDFELCDLKIKNLYNYHFKEHYKNNKILFDYTIYKGKCKSTNARYLMKKLGIISSLK